VGTHLCYNDAIPIQQGGHSSGAIRFFDNTYTQVGTDFKNTSGLIAPDIHELNTPAGQNGQYVIQDVYQTIPANLTTFGGPEDGYILNGCFQVINTVNRTVDFQWCSLDYVSPDDTYVYLHKSGRPTNGIAGTGSKNAPWDYFHLNSIDQNIEGDFIISGRHVNAVYKIAGMHNNRGTPGSVLWTLGGKRNQFDLQGFSFSRQHTVRFQEANATSTTISLFDNGSDGTTTTSTTSSGKVIEVNNTTMVATLRLQLDAPEPLLASSQGSLQALANGNWLIGWGAQPYYTEYSNDGRLLYHAQFGRGPHETKGLSIQSYRAWKHPWVGRPAVPPDIVAYAHNCSGALYAHVSWNGATEVSAWRFYVSRNSVGPWDEITPASTDGSTNLDSVWVKTGFETRVLLKAAGSLIFKFVYAEALDKRGRVLGRTLPVMTFVPGIEMAQECGEAACPAGLTRYRSADSLAWHC